MTWIGRPDPLARATRIVTPCKHSGVHEQVQAPAESQARGAEAAAPGTSGTATPAEPRFPTVFTRGAGADRTSQTHPGEGRCRTRGVGRSSGRHGHRVAGDRHPSWRDQAGGPPALPAPPPRQRQPSASSGLTHPGQDAGVKRQLKPVNMCCWTLGTHRCSTIAARPAETMNFSSSTTGVVRLVMTFFTSLKARGARRALDGASISRELARPGGRCSGEARRGGRKCPAGVSPHLGWQLRLSALRRTAGCRPSATPGSVRHRRAAVTPAERSHAGTAILPGAPVLSRAKITVKSAPACGLRVARDSLRSLLTVILLGT